jgi:hypothetical protein
MDNVRPAAFPDWADDSVAQVVQPPAGKAAVGWLPGEEVPAAWWNWWQKLSNAWHKYVDEAVRLSTEKVELSDGRPCWIRQAGSPAFGQGGAVFLESKAKFYSQAWVSGGANSAVCFPLRIQGGRRLLSVDLMWTAPSAAVKNTASVVRTTPPWTTLPASHGGVGTNAVQGSVVQTQFSGGSTLLWTKSTINVTQPQPAYSEALEYWLEVLLGSTAESCALRAVRIHTQG